MLRGTNAGAGVGSPGAAAAAGRQEGVAREASAGRGAAGRGVDAVRDRQVRVRELRQNLSVYLERVVAGETLEVTSRGRPVAVLAPLPPPATMTERLVAVGRAKAPTRRPADLTPVSRLGRSALGPRLQRALDQARGDAV